MNSHSSASLMVWSCLATSTANMFGTVPMAGASVEANDAATGMRKVAWRSRAGTGVGSERKVEDETYGATVLGLRRAHGREENALL